MIRFGMAGNSEGFAATGHKSSLDSPVWAAQHGLNAFEYSFGRGVNIHTDTAADIGVVASACNVEMSVHAPYYINMASPETEKADNSLTYILQSLRALKAFGGKRCVFHVGSQGKAERKEAFARCMYVAEKLVDTLKTSEFENIILCPETMGKFPQIGSDPEEVLTMCRLSPAFYPCYDFGHLNSVTHGGLRTSDDYRKYIDRIFEVLGEEKAKNMHIHFSKIQYGEKGELRHLTFEDTEYGPVFEPLAHVLREYSMTPVIISESAGTQDVDAAEMKRIYSNLG